MKSILIQNIKSSVLFLLIFCYIQGNQAQENDFWSHVRYGGNIGIGFTNDTFSGVIAPSAIYDFTNQISIGLGVNFGYTDSSTFTATNYGASIITLYNPFPEMQLSAEFEEMGVSRTIKLNGLESNENYWYPALFIGAGYRVGFASIGLRYDVLYDDNKSIYASPYAPFVRIYF